MKEGNKLIEMIFKTTNAILELLHSGMNAEQLLCCCCLSVGEPGQQDKGTDNPAPAGSFSHVFEPCTETHLFTPRHRLLSPLSSVQHLPLLTSRG